eukprot:CAMPEP_0115336182 /NCGR_PEP_ID=MMETSP0270-20121206/88872_1 /TAXON_ID=71861 /ORGANISM="Scrippsiella trochoidea, Strain CCMP3099" /LENGTH=53 /DNA_ID=CAMNT_0002757343 /DNA_START=14 /DNA_END=175 /DNA_ORIENTATION=-
MLPRGDVSPPCDEAVSEMQTSDNLPISVDASERASAWSIAATFVFSRMADSII